MLPAVDDGHGRNATGSSDGGHEIRAEPGAAAISREASVLAVLRTPQQQDDAKTRADARGGRGLRPFVLPDHENLAGLDLVHRAQLGVRVQEAESL